jgi:hypothetical protein
MSEENLMSGMGGESDDSQSQEYQQQIDQEVAAPSLERPEWLQDRYLQGDRGVEEAIKEQAKGYNELRQKLGGFTGAPEAYEFSLPEGIDGEIDSELPAYNQFLEVAKSANMSNETAQELFNIFVGYQKSIVDEIDGDIQQQKQMLGPQADQRLSTLAAWAGNNLTEEQNDVFASMLTTAAGVEVMEAIINKSRSTQMHKTGETAQAPSFTKEDLARIIQTDDRYHNDPQFRKEVLKKAQAIL